MPPTQDDSPLGSIDLDTAPPTREFLALVPFDFAWRHRVCAVSIDDAHDLIVVTSETPASVIARIAEGMPRECQIAHATDDQLCRLIARAYERPRPIDPSQST